MTFTFFLHRTPFEDIICELNNCRPRLPTLPYHRRHHFHTHAGRREINSAIKKLWQAACKTKFREGLSSPPFLRPHRQLPPPARSTLVAPHPLHSLIRDLIINKKIVIAGSRAVMHKRRISPYVRVRPFLSLLSPCSASRTRCSPSSFYPSDAPKTPLAPRRRSPPHLSAAAIVRLINEARVPLAVTHARFQGKLDCHYEGVLIRKVLMFAF